MSKILITGCAGFIGSTLTDKLLELGYDVVGINRFPKNSGIKQDNLDNALKNRNFKLLRGNLIDMDLKEIMTNHDISTVFHAAGKIRTNPDSFNTFLKDNVLTTQALLEACKGRKISKFVLFSSCAVYGNNKESVGEFLKHFDLIAGSLVLFVLTILIHPYNLLKNFSLINQFFLYNHIPKDGK